jgi:hypothetical protein
MRRPVEHPIPSLRHRTSIFHSRGESVNRQSHDGPSPEGMGFVWASRIFAICAEMILPGIAGHWLDGRLETRFLALLGFALGISLAIWHLLIATKSKRQKGQQASDGDKRL